MESYDERRRRDEERRHGRQGDSGPHRDTWWRRESERDDEREERSRFSPDWSREGAEPRYSDHPYYSRNREQDSGEYSRRDRSGGSQGDDRREWEQRSRAAVPRSQRELAEQGEPGDYYDPDWPYDRDRSSGGRNAERSRREMQRSRDEGTHYRGYYSQSGGPFSYPGGEGYVFSESWTLHGPYAGRGPKGYKRSDQQIVEEACQRLERDGHIDASDIEVTAEDSVIRLRGTVQDRQTKRRAEECVES
ncbi:MAG TPA: BON domain-containing protein, partial [Gammaproteobacteria bacterium]